MNDAFGRHITYLRISLTDRCNLRCIYCMPEEGVTSLCHENILRIEEFTEIVQVAAQLGIEHIRLTGGEPLVRKGCIDLVKEIKEIPGIKSVALTTNGVFLARFAKELKEAGLDRINISLDTLDPEQYHRITRRGNLENVIRGIESALEYNFDPVKINVVAVKSLAQNWLDFAKLSVEYPLHVRFIEFMPMGHGTSVNGSGWGPDDVIPTSKLIETITQDCLKAGLGELAPADNSRPKGQGPAQYWKLPNSKGTLGFISSVSDHFCASCNRLRLTADGHIRPCLFSDDELSIRDAVRNHDKAEIEAILKEAMIIKPKSHAHRIGTERMMSQVGG